MSASERLAALADDVARLTKIETAGPNAKAALDALAALPEIVAVVKATERLPHSDDQGWLTGIPSHPTPCALCAALAALDEKLRDAG